MNVELGAKRIGLLRELVPGAVRLAILVNPKNPLTNSFIADVQAASSAVGQSPKVFTASTNRDIDTSFARIVQEQSDVLLIGPDTLFRDRHVQLAMQSIRHTLPAIATNREFVEAGGLMSYGASFTDLFRQVGIYVGRVLKGGKPADLPVVQSTKFELVINASTAGCSASPYRRRCSPLPTR
jgi:putative tryptophan/tyrosine transport system substrate-binding protein